jgi:hypothetical protein
MSKLAKERKQHFELSPANRRRLEHYIALKNEDGARVTPRIKVGDVVNQALDLWLTRRVGAAHIATEGGDGQKA